MRHADGELDLGHGVLVSLLPVDGVFAWSDRGRSAVFLAITGILLEILRQFSAEARAVKVEKTPFLMDTNGYANGRANGDSTGWDFMRQGRMPPSAIIEGPSKPMP